MNTTRRSWFKSLVAMVCAAVAPSAMASSPCRRIKRSPLYSGLDVASGKDHSPQVPFGDEWQQSATLPRLGDPWPRRPGWTAAVREAFGDVPLFLDGERITDDMVRHSEWHCDPIPTGVAYHGKGWSQQWKQGNVMTGILLLNDMRCLSIVAHRENDVWRVEQCVCTADHGTPT